MVYRYSVEWSAETTNEIASNESYSIGGTEEPEFDVNLNEVASQVKSSLYQQLYESFVQKMSEQGYSIEITAIENVRTEIIKRTTRSVFRDYIVLKAYAKLRASATLTFTSDKPLTASPIAPALLLVLKYILDAVVLIVVAYFIIEAVKSWLKSMTTTTTTVTKYDEAGNVTSTETTTKPEPFGIGIVGLILVLMLIVAMFFSFGMPKKK